MYYAVPTDTIVEIVGEYLKKETDPRAIRMLKDLLADLVNSEENY